MKALLDRFGIHPKKSLGQNFMYDSKWLARVVTAAEVGAEDLVLEIGAGAGNLTRLLAQAARHVVAVEIDERLLPVMESELATFENISLLTGDILKVDYLSVLAEHTRDGLRRYFVVANIPYYITGAILQRLLAASIKPLRVVITVQAEVAERIVAASGKMSLLAVSVHNFGVPSIVARVPASAFYPRPEVDSAILRIDLHAADSSHGDDAWFFRVVRAGFSQKRKQLQNSLASGMQFDRERIVTVLEGAGIDPRRRAETLALEEWHWIAERLVAFTTETDGTQRNI